MVLFLVVAALAAAALGRTLYAAFFNNPLLDALILLILAFGIVWNLRVVLRLQPEVRWIETLRQPRTGLAPPPPPKLLAPMAGMLSARNRSDRLTLSTQATQALLDSLSSRLDESREISRYMTGLLIFLGLLGTFYGLLLTVNSIAGVIGGMSAGNGDLNVMFDQLKSGLAQPLHGMGTAFSGSMFGLASALVLGFLDLTAGQAQNRFFNELEEWLATVTRFGASAIGEGSEGSVPAYVQALLEQTAENLETLQNVLSRGEEGRVRQLQSLDGLQQRLGTMTELLQANREAMVRNAEMQGELTAYLRRSGEGETRDHLRSIETLLGRLLTELHESRAQATGEIRNDLRLLARTIAASSGAASSGQPSAGRE